MSNSLDDQAINGDGQAPNLTGIFQRLAAPTVTPSTIATFDDFAAAHAGGIDGLWADDLMEVAIVCGPATLALAARTFQSATNYKGELSAAAYAMANTGAFGRTSACPTPRPPSRRASCTAKGGA